MSGVRREVWLYLGGFFLFSAMDAVARALVVVYGHDALMEPARRAIEAMIALSRSPFS